MAALQWDWSFVNAAQARVNVVNAVEEEPEAEQVVEPAVIEQEAGQVIQMVRTTMLQKGKNKLSYSGHLYLFQKFSADKTKKFWKCEKYKADKCPKRMTTDSSNNIINELAEHNHDTNPGRKGVHDIKQSLRERARTQELPSQIISTANANQPDFVKGQVPNAFAQKKIIRRARAEIQEPPPTPASRELYVIPRNYQYYNPAPGTEELFLLADSGKDVVDVDRILIFGRSSFSQWIHLVANIYVDGTFSISPDHFYQVFVIMGERRGFVMPLMYVLLPSKCEAIYAKMFGMIKRMWPTFNPTAANLDYELALMNALKSNFPGIKLGGCLFHLVKNMKKHLGANSLCFTFSYNRFLLTSFFTDLMRQYREGGAFTEGARMVVAMAFLRPVDIEQAVADLGEYFTDSVGLAALNPILDWFEENYVGHRRGNRRQPALFDNSMWTVYQRTLDGEARTNNHAEAAHRRLQTELSSDHPTLWKLIDGLKNAQSSRDIEYLRCVNGEEPPEKRRKYVQADQKLKRILENYDTSTLIEKLKGISHVYGML